MGSALSDQDSFKEIDSGLLREVLEAYGADFRLEKEERNTPGSYHQSEKTRDLSVDESLCASNFSSECQLDSFDVKLKMRRYQSLSSGAS